MVRHAGGGTLDQIRSETLTCMDQVSQNRHLKSQTEVTVKFILSATKDSTLRYFEV